MKTITEFSGFQLRAFLDKKRELQQAHRPLRPHGGKPKPKTASVASEPAATSPAATSEDTHAPAPVETAALVEPAAPVEPAALVEPTAPESVTPTVETQTASESTTEAAPAPESAPSVDELFKNALAESTKWEGQKLEFALHAVTSVMAGDRHRVKDLKRVVVLQGAEGQSAPKGAVEAMGHFFLPEYLPSLEKPKGKPGRRGDGRGRDSRGDRKGRGRDGKRGDRRGPGGRRDAQSAGGNAPGGERKERDRGRRPQRLDRKPGGPAQGAPRPHSPPKPNSAPKPVAPREGGAEDKSTTSS